MIFFLFLEPEETAFSMDLYLTKQKSKFGYFPYNIKKQKKC